MGHCNILGYFEHIIDLHFKERMQHTFDFLLKKGQNYSYIKILVV